MFANCVRQRSRSQRRPKSGVKDLESLVRREHKQSTSWSIREEDKQHSLLSSQCSWLNRTMNICLDCSLRRSELLSSIPSSDLVVLFVKRTSRERKRNKERTATTENTMESRREENEESRKQKILAEKKEKLVVSFVHLFCLFYWLFSSLFCLAIPHLRGKMQERWPFVLPSNTWSRSQWNQDHDDDGRQEKVVFKEEATPLKQKMCEKDTILWWEGDRSMKRRFL